MVLGFNCDEAIFDLRSLCLFRFLVTRFSASPATNFGRTSRGTAAAPICCRKRAWRGTWGNVRETQELLGSAGESEGHVSVSQLSSLSRNTGSYSDIVVLLSPIDTDKVLWQVFLNCERNICSRCDAVSLKTCTANCAGVFGSSQALHIWWSASPGRTFPALLCLVIGTGFKRVSLVYWNAIETAQRMLRVRELLNILLCKKTCSRLGWSCLGHDWSLQPETSVSGMQHQWELLASWSRNGPWQLSAAVLALPELASGLWLTFHDDPWRSWSACRWSSLTWKFIAQNKLVSIYIIYRSHEPVLSQLFTTSFKQLRTNIYFEVVSQSFRSSTLYGVGQLAVGRKRYKP